MVKIRYSELPVGLHVAAKADGRHTVVYLLPGLTPTQRRAALIRVRSSARMGQGPRLPALGIALALMADRVRMTARNSVAAMRGHPMLLLPPLIILVSSVIMLMLMSFVTLSVGPSARAGGQAPRGGISAAAGYGHHELEFARPSARRAGGTPRRPGHHRSMSRARQASVPAAADYPSPSARPSRSGAEGPPWPWHWPEPGPSSSGGRCIKLGPLWLCEPT